VRREFLTFREGHQNPYHPIFTIALATGVGKTRLAGAIMALLWLSNEARTFMILAPRRAVLRRFDSALDPRFREYIFIDPNLIPEPRIVRADEIDSPSAFNDLSTTAGAGPLIFLLSPQLIATSERFTGRPEYADESAADAVRMRNDLVVLADEAHHIGKVSSREASAWAAAIRGLHPCLQLGLTATPRGEPGENLLYDYPLRKALAEQRYTKAVQILVRQFREDWGSAEDVDRTTVDFALQRLAIKEAACAEVTDPAFPRPKPVAVIFARDIEHATAIHEWLIKSNRVPQEQLLLTHSRMSKSEEEIERLLGIEDPANSVRVVVNVMELTEGWDVTNVYVVAPLRAMATFAGALQALGRGLRLPAGRRVGNPEADSLDVVCFGKEALEKIVREATEWAGRDRTTGSGVVVKRHDAPSAVRVSFLVPKVRDERIEMATMALRHSEISLALGPEALRQLREAVVQSMELAAARVRLSKSDGQVRTSRDRFVTAAAMRIIRNLPQYLSDDKHRAAVATILYSWLKEVAGDTADVSYDPVEVAEEVTGLLLAGARGRTAEYLLENKRSIVEFQEFHVDWDVDPSMAELGGKSIPSDVFGPLIDLGSFEPRRPYTGWQNGLHKAYSFDSAGEAWAAKLMDQAADILWWVRNEPRRLSISTPAGNYHPDFIAKLEEQASSKSTFTLLLEVKGDVYWESPRSVARLKAAAADTWCAEQRRTGVIDIRYGIALESVIEGCSGWPELAPRLLPRGLRIE
jgi:superfamily II DNA or RNA helicase